MKIFITGASGFIGNALLEHFLNKKVDVFAGVREFSDDLLSGASQVALGDFFDDSFRSKVIDGNIFNGIDVVIHVAGLAHMGRKEYIDDSNRYKKINCDATLFLAENAAKSNVKRFVFLSSAIVNGCLSGEPFKESDLPKPYDPCSQSKYDAELGLLRLSEEAAMDVVIIRPVMVYGPNAPGNFSTLLKYVKRSTPLPFGAIYNKRSFVAIENLVSFISLCSSPESSRKAANQIFLISDDYDVSTTVLLRKIRYAFHKKENLIPVPAFIISLMLNAIFGREYTSRLIGNFQVDITKAKEVLGWTPVVTMDAQLKKIAEKIIRY